MRAFGFVFLGRPRSPAAGRARETDGYSLAAMYCLAALCLIAGIVPGLFIDALAPVAQALVIGRMPVQTGVDWMSIVPIAESRSSYNGLIILIFLAISGTLTAMFIHRYATRATRRSAIWDCGYPDPSAATQYTSSSFAMPIRRVFAVTVFGVREKVDMPRPGESRPARFHVKVIDPPWAEEDDLELFGVSREDTHAFAAQCLTRRLKVIGLMPAAA